MKDLNQLMENYPDNLDRRATLIRQLKEAQHNLVNVLMVIAEDALGPEGKASRDFRAKYPDDVALDQVNGPVWFGAECIAAGSHIANHEVESVELRPHAINLTKYMAQVREAIREQCFTDRLAYSEKLKDLLRQFDAVWVNFELRYVSLMCNVMTEELYYYQQDTIVLFSEATIRGLQKKYITTEMVEMMDPVIMFAIPRLAIVCGLTVYPEGPLDVSKPKKDMPPFFRGYRQLLTRIKELLGHLTSDQLTVLEQALCSAEGVGTLARKKVPRSPGRSVDIPSEQVLQSSDAPEHDDKHIHEVNPAKPLHHSSDLDHTTTHQELASPLASPGEGASLHTTGERRKVTSGASPSALSADAPRVVRRNRAGPAGFASAEDLIHRLFVAISGVADQLQTNHAKDLRVILKHVFAMCQSTPSAEPESDSERHTQSAPCTLERGSMLTTSSDALRIPAAAVATVDNSFWISDDTPACSSCHERFSWTRRRHHCRNCGNVVCAKCSSNSMPLPKVGTTKPVRVCTNCHIQLLAAAVQRTAHTPQPSQLLCSYS